MRVTAHESGSDFGHAKRKLHNRKMRSRNGSSGKWHAKGGKSPIHLSRREENPKISVFILCNGQNMQDAWKSLQYEGVLKKLWTRINFLYLTKCKKYF